MCVHVYSTRIRKGVMLHYGMGHKKVPVSCFFKSRFLAVQRKRGTFGTRHSSFHGKLNGLFHGKLNGPFNGKLNARSTLRVFAHF